MSLVAEMVDLVQSHFELCTITTPELRNRQSFHKNIKKLCNNEGSKIRKLHIEN